MVRVALGASLAISASPAVSADPASFVVAFAAMGGLQLLLYARTPLEPARDPAAGSRLPRLRRDAGVGPQLLRRHLGDRSGERWRTYDVLAARLSWSGGFWPVRLASISTRGLGLVATQTPAFSFADIEGTAAMAQRLGDAYAGVLADCRRLIWAGLAGHGG